MIILIELTLERRLLVVVRSVEVTLRPKRSRSSKLVIMVVRYGILAHISGHREARMVHLVVVHHLDVWRGDVLVALVLVRNLLWNRGLDFLLLIL